MSAEEQSSARLRMGGCRRRNIRSARRSLTGIATTWTRTIALRRYQSLASGSRKHRRRGPCHERLQRQFARAPSIASRCQSKNPGSPERDQRWRCQNRSRSAAGALCADHGFGLQRLPSCHRAPTQTRNSKHTGRGQSGRRHKRCDADVTAPGATPLALKFLEKA